MVMLVAAAGNTAMQSVLPAIGARLHIPDVWVSLAFSWSALLWVLTAPRWARQSDRRGRRQLMVVGLLGFTASMLLCGLVLWAGLAGWLGAGLTFAIFALFRSLYGGFGSAAPPAVQAYVAARTAAEERTKALSLLASSFGLGTVIGPTLAPFLIFPVVGLSGPLFAFSLIGLIVLIALRLVLPDDSPTYEVKGRIAPYPSTGGTAPALADDEGADGETDSEMPQRLRWHDQPVRPWNIAGLLGGHAQAMILGVIGFLILDRLHLRTTPDLAAAPIGHVLWVGAMATLLAQWGLIPILHLAPRTAVLVGSAVAAAGAAIVGLSHSLGAISTGFAISALGFGLFRPGFTAGASLSVPRAQQGAVAGQTASINGAAYVAAPAIGVLLYNWHAGYAFALIAGICLIIVAWGRNALRTPPCAGVPAR